MILHLYLTAKRRMMMFFSRHPYTDFDGDTYSSFLPLNTFYCRIVCSATVVIQKFIHPNASLHYKVWHVGFNFHTMSSYVNCNMFPLVIFVTMLQSQDLSQKINGYIVSIFSVSFNFHVVFARNDDVKRTDIICFSIMMKKLKDTFFSCGKYQTAVQRGRLDEKRAVYQICNMFRFLKCGEGLMLELLQLHLQDACRIHFHCLSCFPGIIRGIPKRIMHMS
ncbi:uncharacterized protein A4U43_C09F6170 [Asparagus officinalis]|uniref:Uncharacterized protein n=1 Tax=Asparagus officinalis TaxID=4686 RepID=A0A5P1E5W7_ASPOF|nr:uncharacterized protein A4U43_C09F6170 [Asparagus officinalis]